MDGRANRRTGALGEQAAAEYLKRRRWRILETNYRCRQGEIDLIAEDRHYLIFVEVKTRKNADFAEAREFVTAAKQRRVRTAAALWLSVHPTDKQPRFDVIEVYGEGERVYRINHLENAFE